MTRKIRLPVLLCLSLGSALLLHERLQSPVDVSSTNVSPVGVSPAVINTKIVNVSFALPPRQLTHRGVLYSLPFGDGKSPSMYVFEIDSGVGYLDRVPHVLHNHNGGLYLLGKSYGKVEYGDHVEVTTSDRVFVNGYERVPATKS